jgi:DNA-binding HxlR family transcriptional regulator
VRVEYALTDKGADLAAAIEALASWAERWTTATAPA